MSSRCGNVIIIIGNVIRRMEASECVKEVLDSCVLGPMHVGNCMQTKLGFLKG